MKFILIQFLQRSPITLISTFTLTFFFFYFFLMKILFIAQKLLVGRSRLSLTVKWSVKASWIALLFLSSETCSSTQEISCVCIKIARCSLNVC